MSEMTHWLTTKPNPHSPATGFDAGQRGWRLHAIVTDKDSFSGLGRQSALCGLQPIHGWSLDLFIEEKCARCQRKLGFVKNADTHLWEPIR